MIAWLRRRYKLEPWCRVPRLKSWRRAGFGLIILRRVPIRDYVCLGGHRVVTSGAGPGPLNVGLTLGRAWLTLRWA